MNINISAISRIRPAVSRAAVRKTRGGAKIGGKARARLYKKLCAHLSNNVGMEEALLTEQKRAAKSLRGKTLAKTIERVLSVVRQGQNLGTALGPFIPRVEQMILDAGDEAGDVEGALESAGKAAVATQKIRSAILSAVLPAALNFIVLLLVMLTLGIYIIPQFTIILDPTKWIGTAHQLYVFSLFVRSPWFYVVLAILGVFMTVVLVMLPFWKSPLRRRLDRYPPWSIYRTTAGAGWMIALSSLVKSGMQIPDALESIRKDSQPWLAQRTAMILAGVQAGQNLGVALQRAGGVFPEPDIVEDLAVYSELPDFGERLFEISNEWMDEALEKIKQKAGITKNALMFLFGVCLIWFTLGTIQIQNSISAAGPMLGLH